LEYRELGNTGIIVSRLCFGSLTIGPLQANLEINEGADLISKALNGGINFIDTAKFYNTYPYIKRALENANRDDIVISSRSYDYTYEGMKESVEESLRELEIDHIDIFGLHEQESIYTLRGHSEAIEYLKEAKSKGLIRAIGVSTHNISVVEAVCNMKEIDVIHPILNHAGLGIGDGSVDDMLKAIEKAKSAGKGIYTMKPLGGGNLIEDTKTCFDFLLSNNNIDSIAVGMQWEDEITANIAVFEGRVVPDDVLVKLRNTKRRLLIQDWCEGCGKCVERCTSGALKIINNKCVVDTKLCRLCSYCSSVCPQFCIKII